MTMNAIQLISQDVFDKVRSRFSNLEMGDTTGAVTIDPREARFFDFDFVLEGVDLGRVSISLNDLGSLKIFYSQGITENQDSQAKQLWFNFLKEMRYFSMRRLLRFDTRDIAKTNLDKKDFNYLAVKGDKENTEMSMNESKWNHKSTKKTSRSIEGRTEVIVRHHKPVDEMYAGSRSQRKNIKAIFIQNKDGERFKYPFIHTAGAFAMAQHVDHGGIPHDPAGKAIIQMSEQIAQLQEFQRKVQHQTLHQDAMGITERTLHRLTELKSRILSLGKKHHYESWLAEFNEQEPAEDDSLMIDDVTMEEYKSKFTQTSFQEELTGFFPLIHNIMKEASKVDLEEFANDTEVDEGHTVSDTGRNIFNEFEDWADTVERGELTPDQIDELKAALDSLPRDGDLPKLELGDQGSTAWTFFNELGIDDSDLKDKLENMSEIDADSNAMQVFVPWAEKTYPELLPTLGLSSTAPSPTAQPMATAPQQPVAESIDTKSMMREIAETVKRFYNAANEDVGPFRSEEAVCLEVEKSISEKYGDEQGKRASLIARKFMEKLSHQWEETHHKDVEDLSPTPEADGLSIARLKELLGNVKQKVENITNGEDAISTEDGIGADHADKSWLKQEPSKPSSITHTVKDTANGLAAFFTGKDEQDMMARGELDTLESTDMTTILKLAGLNK